MATGGSRVFQSSLTPFNQPFANDFVSFLPNTKKQQNGLAHRGRKGNMSGCGVKERRITDAVDYCRLEQGI